MVIHSLCLAVAQKYFGRDCWLKGQKKVKVKTATSGLPSLCKAAITWNAIDSKLLSMQERKMIECFFIYQFEYQCRKCSRVKSFSNKKDIKDKSKEWHAREGPGIQCPFCAAEKGKEEEVQGLHGTTSKVYTESKHQFEHICRDQVGRFPCLHDLVDCHKCFESAEALFRHYMYSHAKDDGLATLPFFRAMGFGTGLIDTILERMPEQPD